MAVFGCGLMFGGWAGLLGSFASLLAAVMYRIRIEGEGSIAVTPPHECRKTNVTSRGSACLAEIAMCRCQSAGRHGGERQVRTQS